MSATRPSDVRGRRRRAPRPAATLPMPPVVPRLPPCPFRWAGLPAATVGLWWQRILQTRARGLDPLAGEELAAASAEITDLLAAPLVRRWRLTLGVRQCADEFKAHSSMDPAPPARVLDRIQALEAPCSGGLNGRECTALLTTAVGRAYRAAKGLAPSGGERPTAAYRAAFRWDRACVCLLRGWGAYRRASAFQELARWVAAVGQTMVRYWRTRS